jgi:WD40 repeat protein
MPQLWRCSNGHQWQADDAPSGASPVPACPVCGTPDSTILTAPDEPLSSRTFYPSEIGASPPLPTTDPLAPLRHGRSEVHPPLPQVPGFEILEELGQGGMGIVYRARQLEPQRIVALKVIRRERLAHPDVLRRFRREAQAAARLSHPNIVAVYGSDSEGDVHYLAMEYVPGVTLQRLVDVGGPLPPERACDYIRQTALGLQHADDQALVHRDIKPSNLMVVAPTGTPPPKAVVKLLDMGVARLYQLSGLPDEPLTTLTRDGAVVGTPDYIAPEQLENPHGADIRADLYSLGCTFYFLLSGQVPFPGGTLIQKLDRQRWQTPPSVDQLRSDVPAPVAAVVRRLMAKHPDDRYRMPADVAAALEQLVRTGVLPQGHQPAPLREVGRLTGHRGAIADVAFLTGGQAISGGADRLLHLWNPEDGREVRSFGATAHEVSCVAVLPRAGQILAGQGVSVRVYDPASGREVGRLNGHTNAVRRIDVSRDGRVVLTGGDDRTARLWDVQTGRELLRLTGHRGRVTAAVLSPDARFALTADHEQALRLWDARTGKEVRSFAVPRGPVLAAAFAPDGATVLSAHFDTTLRLWEVTTGRELRRFKGHKQMVSAAAFAPDGVRVVSASHDGTVRVWDPASGAELWSGAGHAGPVTAALFAPDGRSVLSAGVDGTLRLWALPEE